MTRGKGLDTRLISFLLGNEKKCRTAEGGAKCVQSVGSSSFFRSSFFILLLLILFRYVSISINSKFTDIFTYKQTLSYVHSYNLLDIPG